MIIQIFQNGVSCIDLQRVCCLSSGSASSDQIPLRVFPNPVSSGTLHFNKTISGELYHMSGRIVLNFDLTDNISVLNLQTGIYFIKSELGEICKVMIGYRM
jgi:hypothetical protein